MGFSSMKKAFLLTILLLLFSHSDHMNYADRGSVIEDTGIPVEFVPAAEQEPSLEEILDTWNSIDTGIEGGRFSWRGRWRRLTSVISLLREKLLTTYGQDVFLGADVYFPVEGGHLYDVGGVNGSGYRPRHSGHDIFVRDRDYDSRNDETGEAYLALAMRSAVVVSAYEDWQPGSALAAGNHVWMYNPARDIVLYYAHLDSVIVKEGDFVQEGTPIGMIGRTGVNAYERTSPTHVHVMAMRYNGNRLAPYNFYPELVESIKD